MGNSNDVLAALANDLEAFVARKVVELGRDGATVGLSGGIDSAVVAAIAARALGPDRVLALILPDKDSDPRSKKDALALAAGLGVRAKVIEITDALSTMGVYKITPLRFIPFRFLREWAVRKYLRIRSKSSSRWVFLSALSPTPGDEWIAAGAAYARVKHRVRMVHLYFVGELTNQAVLGCCNKSELLTGFFVKYGDSASDIAPIEGLYKTQVRALAGHYDIPRAIVSKPPSPDLIPGVTDEYALGITYELLDRILARLESGADVPTIATELGIAEDVVHHVQQLVERSWFLRSPPLVP